MSAPEVFVPVMGWLSCRYVWEADDAELGGIYLCTVHGSTTIGHDVSCERAGGPTPDTQCRVCGAWIALVYGADSPAEHANHEGTREDPRAPGDWDDICAPCGYGS